jgi:hypothetical protein
MGDPVYTTVSEYEIARDYYPRWREKMVAKYGEELVKSNYCFLDCLGDWMIVNMAWESVTGPTVG